MEKKSPKRKKKVADDKTVSYIESELGNSKEIDLTQSVKLTPKAERRVKKLNLILDKRQERTHKSIAKLINRSPTSD